MTPNEDIQVESKDILKLCCDATKLVSLKNKGGESYNIKMKECASNVKQMIEHFEKIGCTVNLKKGAVVKKEEKVEKSN